jgi:hypothetical protein
MQFLERCSGTFDLHGEIANADALIRYCFEDTADAEAFHAQFAPMAVFLDIIVIRLRELEA